MATYSFERVVTPGEPDYVKVVTVGAGAPTEPIEHRIPLGGETLVRRLGGVDDFAIYVNQTLHLRFNKTEVILPAFTDSDDLLNKLTQIFKQEATLAIVEGVVTVKMEDLGLTRQLLNVTNVVQTVSAVPCAVHYLRLVNQPNTLLATRAHLLAYDTTGAVTIASTPRGNIWSVEANKEVESISTDDPPYICNNGLKIVALNSSILGVVTGPPDPLIVEIKYKPL